jgi:hypothetical protein
MRPTFVTQRTTGGVGRSIVVTHGPAAPPAVPIGARRPLDLPSLA